MQFSYTFHIKIGEFGLIKMGFLIVAKALFHFNLQFSPLYLYLLLNWRTSY